MNILGRPFREFVTNQINVRQNSLKKGSGNNTDDLLYQQTKTPWLRFASSVDIKDSKFRDSLIGLGFSSSDISGQTLAKNFILQGGAVSKTSNSFTPNQGINFGTNFKGAYGWGGTTERGAVPMPGLTGASVKYINNGALTKTEVSGKCFSRNQLAIIDALYMRPGYTVLLEFGWSVYLDNSSNLQTFDNFNSPALRHLFSSSKNHYKLLKKIDKETEDRFGNYGGIYGKISNFNWKFNPDGSYDWSVNIVGVGDIIESLKINSLAPLTIDGEEVEESDDKDELPIISQATRTTLNAWLFSIYQSNKEEDNQFRDVALKNFTSVSNDGSTSTSTLNIKNGEFHCQIDSVDQDKFLQIGTGPQVYITFGYLIAWIQKNILLKNPNNGIPVCAFNMNFNSLEFDQNFFRFPQGNFSSLLLNVLTPYSQPPVGGTFPEPATLFQVVNNTLVNFRYDSQNARLSQVLLNINGIASILEECPEDEDNSKSLLDFLKRIIGVINKSTGGINDIVIELGDDQSKIIFRSKSPQSFDSPPSGLGGRLCTFNTFGTGTIIRDLAINGNIPSNFSSMITIGAQANGNQTAGDATSFSSYNAGLVDRIMPIKVSEGSPDKEGDSEEKKELTDVEKIEKIIKTMTTAGGFWKYVSGGAGGVWEDVMDDLEWLSEDINTLNSNHTQYVQYLMAYLSQPKEEGGAGKAVAFFLPFNLNMDIDGLSGIRLFERFKVDDKVLPLSYKSSKVDILVKSVDHDISLNSWTTKIGTLSVPSK